MNNKEFIEAFERLPEPSEMLRIMIESYEIPRSDICEMTGLSNSTLTLILQKTRRPNYKTYRKLVLVFCQQSNEKES